MITKLTPEQQARFPEWVDRWTRIGLSTERADRPRAEQAVKRLYEFAGLKPQKVLWITSPMAGAIAAPLAANFIAALKPGKGNVSAVGSAVGSAVRSAVGSAVRSAVWWHYWWGGQFWAAWPAYITFFRDVLGVSIPAIDAYADLVESAGYVWLNQDFAIVSERPTELHRNDRGQLHRADGPALLYPDGWALWMINGVNVGEQLVMMPETQSLQHISDERNAEVKRIRIERFAGRDAGENAGWQRYLTESKAKVLNRRRNDIEGTREALMRTSSGETVLVCHCPSTGRVYSMEVAPEIENCLQAQNWLWSGSRTAERFRRPLNVVGRT